MGKLSMNYRPVFVATMQSVGLFIAGFVPVLGQIIALFTPVPLILLYVRNGKQKGLASLIASSAIIGLLGSWQMAAVFFFSFGLIAIGVSEGMSRQWKPEAAALAGGLLPAIVLFAAAVYYFSGIGKNPVTAIEDYFRGALVEAAGFYAQLGLSDMAEAVESVSDAFIRNLARLIPGIIVTISVFQAACCYGLSRMIMARTQRPAPGEKTAFTEWHAPDIWIWGLIIALALIMAPSEAARFTGLNLSIFYAVVYLAQGAAIVDHYLRKAGIKTFMRGLLHALILALPSITFVVALGVVDIWADFRKVRRPIKNA